MFLAVAEAIVRLHFCGVSIVQCFFQSLELRHWAITFSVTPGNILFLLIFTLHPRISRLANSKSRIQ